MEAWTVAQAASTTSLPASPSYDQRLELWHHLLGGGVRRNHIWVSLDSLGEITGFASAGHARVLREKYDGEVSALYVAPLWCRRGVGMSLLREVFAWFESQKFRSVIVWVPQGGDAIAYFARMGAQATKELKSARIRQSSFFEQALTWSDRNQWVNAGFEATGAVTRPKG